jgi:hypothetical protein
MTSQQSARRPSHAYFGTTSRSLQTQKATSGTRRALKTPMVFSSRSSRIVKERSSSTFFASSKSLAILGIASSSSS